jgi:uncharacterized protein YcfL
MKKTILALVLTMVLTACGSNNTTVVNADSTATADSLSADSLAVTADTTKHAVDSIESK